MVLLKMNRIVRSFLFISIIVFIAGCSREEQFDYTKCLEKPDLDERDMCLYNGVNASKDRNVCLNILKRELRAKCFLDLALNTGDTSYCGLIGNEHGFNSCMKEVAINRRDPFICDRIIMASYREDCKITVENLLQPGS